MNKKINSSINSYGIAGKLLISPNLVVIKIKFLVKVNYHLYHLSEYLYPTVQSKELQQAWLHFPNTQIHTPDLCLSFSSGQSCSPSNI